MLPRQALARPFRVHICSDVAVRYARQSRVCQSTPDGLQPGLQCVSRRWRRSNVRSTAMVTLATRFSLETADGPPGASSLRGASGPQRQKKSWHSRHRCRKLNKRSLRASGRITHVGIVSLSLNQLRHDIENPAGTEMLLVLAAELARTLPHGTVAPPRCPHPAEKPFFS